jgi:hypothetical protein
MPIEPTTWTPDPTSLPIHAIKQDGYLHVQTSSHQVPTIPRKLPIYHDFQDYVNALPSWERAILEHITFSTSPEELFEVLNDNGSASKIYLVSDGSQITHSMSYGWVLGTSTGEILAENYGPCYGIGTSHRAEGWGMLSGGRFLYHLALYTRQTYGTRIPILSISDNKGLVTRVSDRHKYTMVYANATLAADWDLTEQIHQTGSKVTKTTIASMNSFQCLHNTTSAPSHLLSPLLPAARCNFAIAHTTYQGHYTKVIRQQLALPPLFEYLRGRHHWRDGVETTIAWDSFQEA